MNGPSPEQRPAATGRGAFCTACGQHLDAHWQFCEHCGQPIDPAEKAPAAAAVSPPATDSGAAPSSVVLAAAAAVPKPSSPGRGKWGLAAFGMTALVIGGLAVNLTYCGNVFHRLPQSGEGFSQFPRGWSRSAGATASSVVIDDGRLSIAAGSGAVFPQPADERFAFSLELILKGGKGTAGIRLRDADDRNYHEILIRSDGAAALVEVLENKLRLVEPWTTVPKWKGADQPIEVRVLNYAPNGPLVAYINGEPVVAPTSTDGDAPVGTRMGLWAYSNDARQTFRVSFDHLRFWKLH